MAQSFKIGTTHPPSSTYDKLLQGEAGVYPSPFELQPGQWTVRLITLSGAHNQDNHILWFFLQKYPHHSPHPHPHHHDHDQGERAHRQQRPDQPAGPRRLLHPPSNQLCQAQRPAWRGHFVNAVDIVNQIAQYWGGEGGEGTHCIFPP